MAQIHAACQCNSASCIPLLIDGGADVNALSNKKRTALHWASQHNSPLCVSSLINSGIDLNARDNRLCTALHVASIHNSVESASLLIAAGADIAVVNDEGKIALDHAKEKGYTAIIDLLNKSSFAQ